MTVNPWRILLKSAESNGPTRSRKPFRWEALKAHRGQIRMIRRHRLPMMISPIAMERHLFAFANHSTQRRSLRGSVQYSGRVGRTSQGRAGHPDVAYPLHFSDELWARDPLGARAEGQLRIVTVRNVEWIT